MWRSFIYFCVIFGSVNCGTNLCKNGAKVDSITYINNQNMWFFTSGGNYWLVKANDFPPKTEGTPLPGGFKRGDAAIYKNTLDACASVQNDNRPQEQEIHLLEMVDGENKILVYDLRSHKWSDKAVPYNQDKGLGQAKVDWTKTIDAAFAYKMTNIVVIQGLRYAVVDIKGLCTNPNGFGEGKQSQKTIDLNVQAGIDATAAFNDKFFYLFQDQVFWKIEITSVKLSEGKLTTIKNMQQDIVTEFFFFKEDCKLPPPEAEVTVEPPKGGPVGEAETPAGETPASEVQQTEAPHEQPAEESVTTEGSKEGGFPWIILIIVIIIIVLIAIVLIACLAMRKKKPEDAEGGPGAAGAAGGAEVAPGAVGSKTGSKMGSKTGAKSDMGTSPSGTSQRSTGMSGTGGAGGAGGSKTGGKASPKGVKGGSSNLGTSPSTMSVRSNAGVATSKTGSTTGGKK